MSDTDFDPFAYGAADAVRLAREVQDLGFDAARAIVERFVEIFAQFSANNGASDGPYRSDHSDGGGNPFRSWGSDATGHSGQPDMQRATDAYLTMLSRFTEAGLRFLDAIQFFDPARFFDPAGWGQAATPERDDLRLPDVAPGGRTSARVWLHNTTASAATDVRPWCPGMTGHSGASLPSSSVTCAPARIERLGPDASSELLVTVSVGEDTPPGTYHGQLLVDGLPDVVFPLRTTVMTPSDAS
jgi:hypothetical protein